MTWKAMVGCLLVTALVVGAGCQSSPVLKGNAAGGYAIKVVDRTTGMGVAEATVEWDYFFKSNIMDPQQHRSWGLVITDLQGNAKLPRVIHPASDQVVELHLVVTVAGYLEAKKTIKAGREIEGNCIRIRLIPIDPLGPSLESQVPKVEKKK